MTIRWYRLAVFALWLAAMSWLTVRKILPPFFKGEPPAYESARGDKPRPPVAWHVYLNEHRLGWALSEISQQSTDTTEIHSLVHFDRLPLDELLPIYLRAIARASTHAAGSTEMEVESNLITNPLNQLVSFDSKFRPKGGQSLVKIEGSVEGDKLKLTVHVGDYDNPNIELPMPDNKIRDSFAPEMELRGLHLGQSWTIVSLQPVGPAKPSPGHDSRAAADGSSFRQGGRAGAVDRGTGSRSRCGWWSTAAMPAKVPAAKRTSAIGCGSTATARVVRQEVLLGDHSLLFMRMPEKDAAKLRDEHKEFQRQPPQRNHDRV